MDETQAKCVTFSQPSKNSSSEMTPSWFLSISYGWAKEGKDKLMQVINTKIGQFDREKGREEPYFASKNKENRISRQRNLPKSTTCLCSPEKALEDRASPFLEGKL